MKTRMLLLSLIGIVLWSQILLPPTSDPFWKSETGKEFIASTTRYICDHPEIYPEARCRYCAVAPVWTGRGVYSCVNGAWVFKGQLSPSWYRRVWSFMQRLR